LLQQNGVKTSRARVAEYGRIVLEGGKSRKRRKRARTTPAANIPATPQSAPAVAAKPTPATPAPTTASAGNVPPPPKEDSPYRSRGPHIANVKMMTPSEREEFEASLNTSEAFRRMSCWMLRVHRVTVLRDSAQPSARFWRAVKTLLK
jgi:hypothetical protein